MSCIGRSGMAIMLMFHGDSGGGFKVKAEDRKAAILMYSKQLFSEHGYHKTQISDIIKLAKIARGTLYQYFENKDDIFITLLENYFKSWKRIQFRHDSKIDYLNITPYNFLKHRIQTALQFFADDYELCNIVLRMGVGLHDSIEDVIRRLERDIITIIKDEIRFGKKTKAISENLDTELAANLLVGAVMRTALVYFVQERESFKDTTVDELAQGVADMFAPGFFKKG